MEKGIERIQNPEGKLKLIKEKNYEKSLVEAIRLIPPDLWQEHETEAGNPATSGQLRTLEFNANIVQDLNLSLRTIEAEVEQEGVVESIASINGHILQLEEWNGEYAATYNEDGFDKDGNRTEEEESKIYLSIQQKKYLADMIKIYLHKIATESNLKESEREQIISVLSQNRE